MTAQRALFALLLLPSLFQAGPAAAATPELEFFEAVPSGPGRPDQTRAKASSVLASYSFDNGANADPQGWTSDDLTENDRNYFHVDDFLPPLAGSKSLWCGVDADPTDPLTNLFAFDGYGNYWHQSWESRGFISGSTGPAELTYTIDWEKEPDYDLIHVESKVGNGDWVTEHTYNTASGNETRTVQRSVTLGETVRFRFRFESDRVYSNEDGGYSQIGAFQLDDLSVAMPGFGVVSSEDFEAEAIGAEATLSGDWQGVVMAGFGDYAALKPGSQVLQDDPATFNNSHFWTFFEGSPDLYECGAQSQAAVPLGDGSFFGSIHNAVRSPWLPLDLGALPRSIRVQFDVYSDSPLREPFLQPSPVYRLRVLYRDAQGLSIPADEGPYWYGEERAWITTHDQFNLPPGVAEVRVVLECIQPNVANCQRHTPLFDNVVVSQNTHYTVEWSGDSGDNTLRWALEQTNSSPGPHRIDFSMGPADQIFLQSPLPTITETVHLAGFAQPGSSPNTLTGATDAVLTVPIFGLYATDEPGLRIDANNCMVEGLILANFRDENILLTGDGNTVRGCWLGFLPDGTTQVPNDGSAITVFNVPNPSVTSYGNTIGGDAPADQNVMGGCEHSVVELSRAEATYVANNLIGVSPLGIAAGGAHGISTGECFEVNIVDNVISGNTGSAFSAGIDFDNSFDLYVSGNIIGLSGDQTAAIPNAGPGIRFFGQSDTVWLGGVGSDPGNVIAGNGGAGIEILGEGAVNVYGNTIGTDITATRTDLGNGGAGVRLTFADPELYRVGSELYPNTIAYNGGAGVKVDSNFNGSYEIRANNIYGNGGLEIDTGDYTGSRPNPPSIDSAEVVADQLSVAGAVFGVANRIYEVDFFLSRACEDPADPQAQIFLGSQSISTGPNGFNNFTFATTGIFFPGDEVTAVSTLDASSTSDVGSCTATSNTPQGVDVVVPLPDAAGTAFPIIATFERVFIAGTTTAMPGADTSVPPSQYITFEQIQLTTTAITSDGLQMCFEYDDSAMESWQEDQLQVLQIIPALSGEWLDVTGSIDPVNNVICTDMAGVGPAGLTCFAIVTLDGPTGAPPAGAGLKLLPNSPNPFNPSTQIRFELAQDEKRVVLEIFDLAGRRVRQLMDEAASAGVQTQTWDGRNDAGRTVASGVYPLRLTVGDEVRMQRLVLLK